MLICNTGGPAEKARTGFEQLQWRVEPDFDHRAMQVRLNHDGDGFRRVARQGDARIIDEQVEAPACYGFISTP